MVTFVLALKEDGKDLEDILSYDLRGDKASELFLNTKNEFSSYIVDGSPENQPFLYLKTVPLREPGDKAMASFISTVCFRSDVKEKILNYITEKL